MVAKAEDDQVDTFEEWALTVHRCQPDEQDKKDVLVQLVRKHSAISIQLLDCETRETNIHSFEWSMNAEKG